MSVESFQSLNPATGEVVRTFESADDGHVQDVLKSADEVFHQDWRFRAPADRAAVVAKAAKLLQERKTQLAQIVTLEMGKPIDQAQFEIDVAVKILEYYATNGERLLAPKTVDGAPESQVIVEPLGVILAIEPWNYPFYQAVRVAGPYLVAGNTIILKHAPTVPQCALAIQALFDDAGAPKGVFTNIFASIPQINSLIDDFRVRGVTLTGSGVAGAAVAERAGRQLKKVVLELGGSDPFIILPDADLSKAIPTVAQGRLMQSGQACTSSKRLIVVGQERGRQVLDALTQAFGSMQAGDPNDGGAVLGPLFAERGLTSLLDQVQRAVDNGAKVAVGGKRVDRPGFYMEATILTDISPSNPIFNEELFGPVLQFYVVETEDEAIKLANSTPFGLGASIATTDVDHAKALARRIDSGMVFINSFMYSGPEVPFGGIKNSGFGRELSELGIMEFVNQKLVRVGG